MAIFRFGAGGSVPNFHEDAVNTCEVAAAAAAARWAQEVWQAATYRSHNTLTLAQLRSAASTARAQGVHQRWADVKGPAMATLKELTRVGWRWAGPFRWVDHQQQEIVLTRDSPAAIKLRLEEAVQHRQEVLAAQELHDPAMPQGARVAFEPVKKFLKNKKYTPQEKGIVRAAVAGALWPQVRLRRTGVLVDKNCKLCGAAEDTLHHRLWCCPVVEEERVRLVPAACLERGKLAPPTAALYSRGLMQRPADWWPAPAETGQVRTVTVQPDGSMKFLKIDTLTAHVGTGRFFADGFCAPSLFKGLARAAWAVAWEDEEGTLRSIVSGPVWRQWPQTAPASEWAASTMAMVMASGPSEIHQDCLSVVREMARPAQEQSRPRSQYAGLAKEMLTHPYRAQSLLDLGEGPSNAGRGEGSHGETPRGTECRGRYCSKDGPGAAPAAQRRADNAVEAGIGGCPGRVALDGQAPAALARGVEGGVRCCAAC